jgi:hypothetical protein
MVLKITAPVSEMSFSRLIEDNAHHYLPIKPIPYTAYIPEHEILLTLGISPEALRRRLSTSRSMHAVELPTGALLVHPIGFLKYFSRFYTKMLLSIQEDMSHVRRPVPKDIH